MSDQPIEGKISNKECCPFSNEEVQLIAKSFSGRYAIRKGLCILGIRSGFHISEVFSLRVGDVLQAGKVVDHVTVQRLLRPEAREP